VTGNVGGNVAGSVGSVTGLNASLLDVAVSTRSTYAGADTSGVTTLLGRVTGPRATALDNLDATISSRMASFTLPTGFLTATFPTTIASTTNITAASGVVLAGVTHTGAVIPTVSAVTGLNAANLDAAVSTRSTYAGGDTSGVTTLLGRVTGPRAAALDLLDVAVSSRLASGAVSLDAAGRAAIADAVLGRNIAGGSNGGRTVAEALAFLRNRWSIVGSTLTVYGPDDVTPLWTATVTGTPGADPVTGNDPA